MRTIMRIIRCMLPRSFFAQLVLGTILAQTLALACYLSYVVVSSRHNTQRALEARIARQIDRLAAACTEQIRQGDTESLRDLLEMAEIAPSIQSTRLTDLQGNTIASSKGGLGRGLEAEERAILPSVSAQHIFHARNGQVEAVTPLMEKGRPVALLWLEPNITVGASNTATILRIAFTYGLLALIVNLLPIFLIVRRMTTPIRLLSRATQRVLRGSGRDPEFPLPITTRNEAGVLTKNFNIMVLELEEQRSGLLETLALLDSMLGNAPVGFAFLDRQFHFVRRNDFFADMFPTDTQSGSGLDGALFHDVQAQAAEVFRTGKASRNVELVIPADGSPRTWLMQFYPVCIQNDEVRWVGIVGAEITERLRAEETLRRTEKLAAAGRLAASVAHEINNPLESVTNLLYILRHHQPMDSVAIEFIEVAQAELARVGAVTQQTLRFYRQSVSRAETDMTEIVDSVVSLYHARLVNSRIALVRQSVGDASLSCFAGEMRQLMANLVVNAIDAMGTGGTLTIRTRRTATNPGVRIAVADTGCGMSEQTLRRIFEAFFTTKQATGTGLGLWVSSEIIEKHGGSARVRSREGKGTCFSIFFPDLIVDQNLTPVEAPLQTARS